LHEVVTASRHAADLARQLLAVTGRPAGKFLSIDANAVIGSVDALLRTAVPKSVRVELEPCEGALWIDGDATQVRQLLLNLVTNAGEAIGPRPGTIRIATGRFRDLDPPGKHEPTDWAVIEVRDDGPGIDEETRRHIFEPTFTTKATGHGLGLAVVHSVVRRHGGRISATSAPGSGTVFRIELPLVTEQVVAAEREFEARVTAAHESEGGVVMIVDDDAAVRRVGAAMLGLANFVVLEAPDAEAARRLLASEPNLACAVVDLVMPDADGIALIDELRALRPGLKVVICSGAVNRIPTGRDDVVVLEKPFRYAQLIEAVWRCIEG
jgi:CheY-like chemotaxis protein